MAAPSPVAVGMADCAARTAACRNGRRHPAGAWPGLLGRCPTRPYGL